MAHASKHISTKLGGLALCAVQHTCDAFPSSSGEFALDELPTESESHASPEGESAFSLISEEASNFLGITGKGGEQKQKKEP